MEFSYQTFIPTMVHELLDAFFPAKQEHFSKFVHEVNFQTVIKPGTNRIQNQVDLLIALKPLMKIVSRLCEDEDAPVIDTFMKERIEKTVSFVSRVELCGTSSMKLFLDRKSMLRSGLPSYVNKSWTTELLSQRIISLEMPRNDPDYPLTHYRCYLIASHVRRLFEISGAVVQTEVIDECNPQNELTNSLLRQEQEDIERFSHLKVTSEDDSEPIAHAGISLKEETETCEHASRPLQLKVSSKFDSSEDLLPTFILCSSVVDQTLGIKAHSSFKDFIGLLKKELEAASYHKYEAFGKVAWDDYLNDLAEGCLTLQLMGVHHLSPVKVRVGEHTDNARASAFLLYNHARLCALFRCLDALIEEGVVPPLSPVENVDFSLLNREEEWTLFWVFIYRYPGILHDLVQAFSSTNPTEEKVKERKGPRSFPTHTLARFLHELVHCLSVYYNRVHVLPPTSHCGSKMVPPHLLPTLWPRIYLLKTVHSVMKSCLELLGVIPPSVM